MNKQLINAVSHSSYKRAETSERERQRQTDRQTETQTQREEEKKRERERGRELRTQNFITQGLRF